MKHYNDLLSWTLLLCRGHFRRGRRRSLQVHSILSMWILFPQNDKYCIRVFPYSVGHDSVMQAHLSTSGLSACSSIVKVVDTLRTTFWTCSSLFWTHIWVIPWGNKVPHSKREEMDVVVFKLCTRRFERLLFNKCTKADWSRVMEHLEILHMLYHLFSFIWSWIASVCLHLYMTTL